MDPQDPPTAPQDASKVAALEAQLSQYARQLADVQAQLAKMHGAPPASAEEAQAAPETAAADVDRLERTRDLLQESEDAPRAATRKLELDDTGKGPSLDFEERLHAAFQAQREEAVTAHAQGRWYMAMVASQRALRIKPSDAQLLEILAECTPKAKSFIPRDRKTQLAMVLMLLSVMLCGLALYLQERLNAQRRTPGPAQPARPGTTAPPEVPKKAQPGPETPSREAPAK